MPIVSAFDTTFQTADFGTASTSFEPGFRVGFGATVTEGFNGTSGGSIDGLGLEIGPLRGLRSARPVTRRRVLKKVAGFLDCFEAGEAQIVLVEDGSPCEASMPERLLRNGGVTERNQPFELILFELLDLPGSIGYQVIPMATENDAKRESLELSAEDRALRDAALHYFGRGAES